MSAGSDRSGTSLSEAYSSGVEANDLVEVVGSQRLTFVNVGQRLVGVAGEPHHAGQSLVHETHAFVDRPSCGRGIEHGRATVTAQHVAQTLGDRRCNSLALETEGGGDQPDPTESAVRIRHTTPGTNDGTGELDNGEPIWLNRGETLDAGPERWHAIRLLHDDVHRHERLRFGRWINTSRRHGARS